MSDIINYNNSNVNTDNIPINVIEENTEVQEQEVQEQEVQEQEVQEVQEQEVQEQEEVQNKYSQYDELVEVINGHIKSYNQFVDNIYFEEIYSKFKTEQELKLLKDFSETQFKINNDYDLENFMNY